MKALLALLLATMASQAAQAVPVTYTLVVQNPPIAPPTQWWWGSFSLTTNGFIDNNLNVPLPAFTSCVIVSGPGRCAGARFSAQGTDPDMVIFETTFGDYTFEFPDGAFKVAGEYRTNDYSASLSVVPEPASALLGGLGLAVVGLAAWSRQRGGVAPARR